MVACRGTEYVGGSRSGWGGMASPKAGKGDKRKGELKVTKVISQPPAPAGRHELGLVCYPQPAPVMPGGPKTLALGRLHDVLDFGRPSLDRQRSSNRRRTLAS